MVIKLPNGSLLELIGGVYYVDGIKVDTYEAEQVIEALTGDER